MAATSTLTTTIISIRTTILTGTSIARDKGIGNITPNTAETLLMATEEPRTSLAAMRVSSQAVAEERAVAGEPVVRVGLAEQAAQAGREASAALVELAAQVAREAPAELAAQVAAVLEHAQAVVVLEHAQAVAVLEHAQAVAGLEHGPVVAALERDQVEVAPELDPLAVPPKNKLVIA